MPSLRNIITITTLSLSTLGSAQQYVLSDQYDKSNFFSHFDFFDGDDPTHGFVNYLSKVESNNKLMAGSIKDKECVYLGVDHMTPNAQGGRESTRVSSKARYTYGLFVTDIEHMPGGCGVWPAYWMFGDGWPNKGEIDILEGVNSQATNAITLHTAPGCVMSAAGGDGTHMTTGDCNAGEAKDGCSQGTKIPFGKAFNEMGGGVLATEWTSATIQVWFFPRSAIPEDITSGNPDPTTWGTPSAKFSGDENCDIPQHFSEHQIVFNTDFCGDWAGAVWGQDEECRALAPTCEEYVANNGDAFRGAYWTINSVKVYNQAGPGKRDNAKRTTFSA